MIPTEKKLWVTGPRTDDWVADLRAINAARHVLANGDTDVFYRIGKPYIAMDAEEVEPSRIQNLKGLTAAEAVVVLAGWEECGECVREVFLAAQIGLPVYTFEGEQELEAKFTTRLELFEAEDTDNGRIYPLSLLREASEAAAAQMVREYAAAEETILEEAQRLVYGDREAAYGHPLDDFDRTARIWSAILGSDVTAEQVGLCMCGVKIARECNGHKRDNLTDLAGYAATVARVVDERVRRAGVN